MREKDKIESLVGLDYKTVARLMKESCAEIERLSNTLLAMERVDMTLSKAYCEEYELLLLERLNFSRKLNEFYNDDYKKSSRLFRIIIGRKIRQVAALHKDTLEKLILLRNYMKLNF